MIRRTRERKCHLIWWVFLALTMAAWETGAANGFAAGLQFGYLHITNRGVEHGESFNRLNFSFADETGQSILDDLSPTVALYDPSNIAVSLTPASWQSALETRDNPFILSPVMFGSYDGYSGKWIYDQGFSQDPCYGFHFTEPLVVGVYRLVITVAGYPTIEYFYSYSGQTELPIISSASFDAHIDSFGNLIWRWREPDIVNPDISTFNQLMIQTAVQGTLTDKLLMVRIPTQMGFAFVPKRVLDVFKGEDEDLILQLQFRAVNGTSRWQTDPVPLAEADGRPFCGRKYDRCDGPPGKSGGDCRKKTAHMRNNDCRY